MIRRQGQQDSSVVVWLALGVSHLLCSCPLLKLPPFYSPHHDTCLKANTIFAETWLALQWARGCSLGAISNLYQDERRKGNDSRPKRPLMAKGTQLVEHSNCSNNFQPLHAATDNRKWEILYFPAETRQAIQWLKHSFEPGFLTKLTKLLCAVWKHFTWEICTYSLSKRPRAPHFHPCTQLRVLNPFCMKYLLLFLFPDWTLMRQGTQCTTHNAQRAYFKQWVCFPWRCCSSLALQPSSGLCWVPQPSLWEDQHCRIVPYYWEDEHKSACNQSPETNASVMGTF